MRKNTLKFAICSLFLAGSIAVVVKVVYESNRPSVLTVLQAHGGFHHQEQPRFTQNGTLTYYPDSSAGARSLRERKLKLSVDRSVIRFDRTTPNKDQSFLLNGQTLVRTTYQAGTQLEVKVLDGTEATSIKFQMATFGLLPILKRLSDVRTQVVYLGATAKGSRFQVKTSVRFWYFYTKRNHLIDRVEDGDVTITYGDYRAVNGLNLPFYQQVRKGDKLIYEIRFDTLNFNPVFAAGFFKSNRS